MQNGEISCFIFHHIMYFVLFIYSLYIRNCYVLFDSTLLLRMYLPLPYASTVPLYDSGIYEEVSFWSMGSNMKTLFTYTSF
jgi:hypothetical protein